MKKTVRHCPVCENALSVSRLSCSKCGTSVEGSFGHGLFSDLNDEESRFVELFVICRGNIKEMEKRLGVSYPTVRNKLDAVIKKLDRARGGDPEEKRQRRMEIIDSIKRGEITPDEGARLLEQM